MTVTDQAIYWEHLTNKMPPLDRDLVWLTSVVVGAMSHALHGMPGFSMVGYEDSTGLNQNFIDLKLDGERTIRLSVNYSPD
jgi:hypothetical protein